MVTKKRKLGFIYLLSILLTISCIKDTNNANKASKNVKISKIDIFVIPDIIIYEGRYETVDAFENATLIKYTIVDSLEFTQIQNVMANLKRMQKKLVLPNVNMLCKIHLDDSTVKNLAFHSGVDEFISIGDNFHHSDDSLYKLILNQLPQNFQEVTKESEVLNIREGLSKDILIRNESSKN